MRPAGPTARRGATTRGSEQTYGPRTLRESPTPLHVNAPDAESFHATAAGERGWQRGEERRRTTPSIVETPTFEGSRADLPGVAGRTQRKRYILRQRAALS